MGMRELPRKVQAWFRTESEIVSDVNEEITFHLDMRALRLQREGLSAAESAAQARREFGDPRALRHELVQRDVRSERRLRFAAWLDDLRQDVRFAVRGFARTPAFTFVAVSTLVLGIGACVAMFTVVNGVLLRPLPYPQSERLAQLWPGQNFCITLADIAGGVPSVQASTGISQWGLTLTGVGDAAELQAQVVDASFFDVFGVRPALGRPFRADERDPANSDVVILGYALWQSRFGGDESVIGRRIDIDGYGTKTREIIGVMPRGFVPPLVSSGEEIAMWIPLHLPPGRELRNDSTWYVNNVVALLRPGVAPESAAQEVSAALRRARAESGLIIGDESLRQTGAMGLVESLVGDTRRPLFMLLGAVGLVLLLACANLANLMLARGERRRAELAARAALGGTRARLVRELLTESALLATIGAVGGVLLATLILQTLRIAETAGLPRSSESFVIDVRVLLFTAAATGLAVLLFALLPALRATSGDLRPALGNGRRSAGVTVMGRRLGSALIALEIALAMLLVTGAALLIASFRTVRGVDSGLDARDVLAVRVSPAGTAYSGAAARQLYSDLLERIRALPGVRSAGGIHLMPFTANNWDFPYLAEGHTPPVNQPLESANFRVVTGDYFAAMDVDVISGRAFGPQDAASAPAVGMINRTMAERLWPRQDAIGREIKLFGSQSFRVIGVVEDVRQHSLRSTPLPEMYLPLEQFTLSFMVLAIETSGEPIGLAAAVRDLIREYDTDIAVPEITPLRDVMNDSFARDRFFAQVLTFFGLIALLLGGVGVYGVMMYAVSARVPEFSIRLALGATHARVARESLGSGLAPVAVGLAAGIIAALAGGSALESLLYGVRSSDPLLIGIAALVLGGTAFFAAWLPMRRVHRVEPMTVLNSG
jgi:putative ABC transport system permease protein